MRLVLLLLFFNSWLDAKWNPRTGDILFQKLNSSFGSAVEGATSSPWSHVGILKNENNRWIVIEAIPPKVRKTPLEDFLGRCKNQFAVTRLRNWSEVEIKKLIDRAELHLNKTYDYVFVLDDVGDLYCSELVYDAINVVKGVGTIKGRPMDFSGALDYWKKYFKQRDTKVPQGEPGISPADVFNFKGAAVIFHFQDELVQGRRLEIFRSLYE